MDSLSEDRGPSTMETSLADESDRTVSSTDTKYAAPDLDHDSDATPEDGDIEDISIPSEHEDEGVRNEIGEAGTRQGRIPAGSFSSDESEADFYDAQEDMHGQGNVSIEKTQEMDNSSQGSDTIDRYATIPQFHISKNNNSGGPLHSTPYKKLSDPVTVDNTVSVTENERNQCSVGWVSFDDGENKVQKQEIGAQELIPASLPTPGHVSSPSPQLSQWVSFDDDPPPLPAKKNVSAELNNAKTVGTVGTKQTVSSPSLELHKNEWVKFEESPRVQRRKVASPQNIDAASLHSTDDRSITDDHQSIVTSSALSSHGSFTSSHDNVSHEYVPLDMPTSLGSPKGLQKERWTGVDGRYTPLQNIDDSSPSSPVRTTAAASSLASSSPTVGSSNSPDKKESWIKFEEEVLGSNTSGNSSITSSPEHKIVKRQNVDRTSLRPEEIVMSQTATVPVGVAKLNMEYSSHPSDFQYIEEAVPVKHSKGNPFLQDLLSNHDVQASPINTPPNPCGVAVLPSSPTNQGVGYSWETFDETDAHHLSARNPFIEHTSTAQSTTGLPKLTSVDMEQGSAQFFFQPSFPNADLVTAEAVQAPGVHLFPSTAVAKLANTPRAAQFKSIPTAAVAPVQYPDEKLSSNEKTDIEVEVPSTSTSDFVDEFPRNEVNPSKGWSLLLRYPDKKKIAGSRDWKRVHIKLIDSNLIQLFENETERQPYREIPIQCSYEFSLMKLQSHPGHGKIHTIKLLYVSFKEKRKLSLRSQHSKLPSFEQLLKIGSMDYDYFRSFVHIVSEALMKLSAFKDHGAHYEQDSISIVVSDGYRCFVSTTGDVLRQSVQVSVYALSFLSGKPECALGLNDVQVKGAEIVSKRDIIPNKLDEWIKMENTELHKCANRNIFVESRFIRFNPMDGCRFKLMSFNVKPRPSPDLPLLVKAVVLGEDLSIQFRVDILVPARPPKQVPAHYLCQNVSVRIPLPQSLFGLFRRKKRIGFYSVKAVSKNAEQIKKGSAKPNLLEVSVGTAMYEHAFKSIVWRIEQLPQKLKVVPTTHILMCNIDLSSIPNYSIIRAALPAEFINHINVEYITPHTTASHTTVRSLAIDSEKFVEKSIKYTAYYEYTVEIDNKYILGPDVEVQSASGLNGCVLQ